MPVHYRSLLVVLILAGLGFLISRPVFGQLMISDADYRRRRNLWLLVTISAFLLPSFWAYALFATVALLYVVRVDSNPAACFPLLLVVLPPLEAAIPSLLDLSHQRLLTLALLLPLVPRLLRDPRLPGPFKLPTDKLFLAYCVLQLVLFWPYITGPHKARLTVLMFLDILLPYYVMSRAFTSREQIRDAMACFVLTMMIFAPMALAEVRLGSLLYAEFSTHWKIRELYGYLTRGDLLRAQLASGQAIVLGYQFAVAIGMWLYLQRRITSAFWRSAGAVVLFIGLMTPFSRGPWLGAGAMVLAFVLMAPKGVARAARWSLVGLLVFAVSSLTPWGSKLIAYLPFVGDVGQETVDYRSQVLSESWRVIKLNPFFGDPSASSSLESLRTGEGIIDIVNVYVAFALSYGFVGVAVFVAIFIAAMLPLARIVRASVVAEDARYLAASVLATLVGILVMISSVSNYLTVPWVYVMVIGFAVACARVLRAESLVAQPAGAPQEVLPALTGARPSRTR